MEHNWKTKVNTTKRQHDAEHTSHGDGDGEKVKQKMTRKRKDRHRAIEQRINFIVKLQNCYVFLVNRLGITSIKLSIIGLAIVYWVFFDGFFFLFPFFILHISSFAFDQYFVRATMIASLDHRQIYFTWDIHYDISKCSTLKYCMNELNDLLLLSKAFV